MEKRYFDKRPMDRMERKILLENLWFVILKMIEKKQLYGYQIREKIKKDLGFWIGNVTAYKVIYDLQNGGYVKAEDTAYRKHYSITTKGKKELSDARKFLHRL